MQIELDKLKEKIQYQLSVDNEVKKIYVSKLFLQTILLKNIQTKINPFDDTFTIYGRPVQIDDDLKEGYIIGVE